MGRLRVKWEGNTEEDRRGNDRQNMTGCNSKESVCHAGNPRGKAANSRPYRY